MVLGNRSPMLGVGRSSSASISRYAQMKRMRLNNDLCASLAKAREAQHLTRKELARKMGYDTNTLTRWELGQKHPAFFALHVWCEALGVEITIQEKNAVQNPR